MISFIRSVTLLAILVWWGYALPAMANANPPNSAPGVDNTATPSQSANAVPAPPSPVSALSSPNPALATLAIPTVPPLMDLTVAQPELWQRIRNDFALPDLDGPLVRQQEQWLLRHPDYLRNAIARSSRYLYHVVDEVEQRGMPSEIALLPFIESAYNPIAYSPAHASGIWQFIPSTGRLYGLEQNFWYDGRRDVVAATDAALDYLEKLYEIFGSWNLALAAYNWGENGVTRAIAKNEARGLPTDYLSLNLPRETRNYVPRLQAVKNIIADPQRYGINLADIPNRPYFAAVTTDRHMDVRLAAKFAQVPVAEFISLNPAYTRSVIRVEGDKETLLLPADKVDIFRANLEQNQGSPLVSWSAYTLKHGDRLSRVAAQHGISLTQLKRINDISSRRKISTGMTLLVPVKAANAAELSDLPAPRLSIVRRHHLRHYRFRSGAVRAAVIHSGKRTFNGRRPSAALLSQKSMMMAAQTRAAAFR